MAKKKTGLVKIRIGSGKTTQMEAVFIGKSFAVTRALYSNDRWTVTHLSSGMGALPGVGVAKSTALRICKAYEQGNAKLTARSGGKYRGQNPREFLRVASKVAPKYMVKLMSYRLKASESEAK